MVDPLDDFACSSMLANLYLSTAMTNSNNPPTPVWRVFGESLHNTLPLLLPRKNSCIPYRSRPCLTKHASAQHFASAATNKQFVPSSKEFYAQRPSREVVQKCKCCNPHHNLKQFITFGHFAARFAWTLHFLCLKHNAVGAFVHFVLRFQCIF